MLFPVAMKVERWGRLATVLVPSNLPAYMGAVSARLKTPERIFSSMLSNVITGNPASSALVMVFDHSSSLVGAPRKGALPVATVATTSASRDAPEPAFGL